MKKITFFILAALLTGISFSQKKIIKEYKEKEFDKCLKLCNNEITKNSEIKQTAYLYKGLILSKDTIKYPQAVDLLVRLKASENFEEFYAINKNEFHEVQKSIIDITDKNFKIKKDLPILKKLAKLYLYKFEFTDSEGTADFKTKTSLTDKSVEYKKYRILLKYTELYNRDIPSYKNAKSKEIVFLYIILGFATTQDEFKPFYNEIYTYLENSNKYMLSKLDEFSMKYAKKDNFTYRKIGNPKTIKKTFDYKKIEERVNSTATQNEKNIKSLANYLCKDFNEAEKVYAIYNWIENNIRYISDSTSNISINSQKEQSEYENRMVRTTQSAEYVLQNKKAVCEGYASLFVALCKSAGISCEYVSGEATGQKSILVPHGWNIVEIDKAWYLIDVTWGKKEYFLANPLSFNENHFTEKNKQLLFAPYTKSYFYKNVKKYAELLNSVKNDSLSLFNLAKVYYEKNDYENAIINFEKFAEKHNKNFDYYYYLGNSYYYKSDKKEDAEKAIVNLKKALDLKHDNVNCLASIASSYQILEKYDTAYIYLNKAKTISPESNYIYREEIILLLNMKDYVKAKTIADSLIINQPKDISNYSLRARVFYKQKQYEKAISDWQIFLAFNKENTYAINYISNCYMYLEEYDKAIEYINQYISLKPNNKFATERKRYLYFLKKDYETAYKLAKEIIEADTTNQNNLSLLAWYSVLTKRYEEAIEYAKKTIKFNKETEVYNSLALAYIYTNQYDKAERIYTEYKDKKCFNEKSETKTFGEFFLKWLKYLEENNMGHKDFEKVKLLLNCK